MSKAADRFRAAAGEPRLAGAAVADIATSAMSGRAAS